MKFYGHKLKLTEFSRLVFNRFFLESVSSVNNVSSVILVLIMHLVRPSSGNCHVGDKVLAKTTTDEENVLRKQNKLVLINNHTYNL